MGGGLAGGCVSEKGTSTVSVSPPLFLHVPGCNVLRVLSLIALGLDPDRHHC